MKVNVNNEIVEYNPTCDRFGRIIETDDYNNGSKKVEVGMFCNDFGYSDVKPFEIIEVSESGNIITIREMEAKLVDGWKPKFVEGGFAGHCTNQNEQEYNYFSKEDGFTMKIRRSKKGFGKGQFKISFVPIKYYDYNF